MAPAPVAVEAPSVSTTSSGIHPDRQKILDQSSNKGKTLKRLREVVVPSATVVKKEGEGEEEKKPNKKQRKEIKRAEQLASEAKLVSKNVESIIASIGDIDLPLALPEPSTVGSATPVPSIAVFLKALVPELIKKRISIFDLRLHVQISAVDAGLNDLEAMKVFDEGVTVGGKKMKIYMAFDI